jgi:hypothetical protein
MTMTTPRIVSVLDATLATITTDEPVQSVATLCAVVSCILCMCCLPIWGWAYINLSTLPFITRLGVVYFIKQINILNSGIISLPRKSTLRIIFVSKQILS